MIEAAVLAAQLTVSVVLATCAAGVIATADRVVDFRVDEREHETGADDDGALPSAAY